MQKDPLHSLQLNAVLWQSKCLHANLHLQYVMCVECTSMDTAHSNTFHLLALKEVLWDLQAL